MGRNLTGASGGEGCAGRAVDGEQFTLSEGETTPKLMSGALASGQADLFDHAVGAHK
jgi:hypothetical protein